MNKLLSQAVPAIYSRSPGWARLYIVEQIAANSTTVADSILPKAIRDPDLEIRTSALGILVANPSHRSAALLSQALRDTEETIREAAAAALGQYRGSLVASRLQSALLDPQPRVRAAAAWALGQTRTAGHSEALEEALKDDQERVRSAAAEALGSIGRPEARTLLTRLAAQDPNPHNRRIAAQAVQRLDGRFATAEEKQHSSRVDAIHALTNAEYPRDRRRQAKAYLLLVRDPSLLADLHEALMAARDDRIRQDVLDVMAALPPSMQLQTRLLQYLHHPSMTLRRRAMMALGEVGNREAISFLSSAAREGDDPTESMNTEDARLSRQAIARIEWRAKHDGMGFDSTF